MKIITYCFIACLIASSGCNKDQYDYKKFTNGMEIVYAGPAKEIIARSGDLRVQLEWKKSVDPAVVSYIVYWNSDRDSTIVPASAVRNDGTYAQIVTGLPEQVQSFKIVSKNDRGYRSVAQDINGVRVYGPFYRSSLYNQRLKSRKFYGTDSVKLSFIPTDKTKVYSKIRYYRKSGMLDSVLFKDNEVTIKSFKAGTKPLIRSYYLPDSTAIDTFSVLMADSLLAF